MSAIEEKYAERMNLTVFEPLKLEQSWTLDTYRSIGGYQVWERLLGERPERGQVIEQLKASGLRGRGGGGVPTRPKGGLDAAHRRGAEVPGVKFRRERARPLPRPRHPALQPARADRGT